MRTFTWIWSLPPTRSNSRSWSTLSNATCISWGNSPISSRNKVPPFANSNRPMRRWYAPVNAPFSWPNNSEAISEGARAVQFTLTKARSERGECLWMARATSSLPVPVSPVMRTVESVGATFSIRDNTAFKAGEVPTISSNIDTRSTSSRNAMFSFWSWSFRIWISANALSNFSRAFTCPVTSMDVPTNSTRSPASFKTGWPIEWMCLLVPSGGTIR